MRALIESAYILRKSFCKASLFASVAFMESVVGFAGGSVRRGQSHNSEVVRLTSPRVGNLCETMTRSTQAAREKNVRSDVFVACAI